MAQLTCPECGTAVQGDYLLPALSRLDGEDQQFALAFILHSGSLKEMARIYGVSYPTVRNRLDDLIAGLSAIIESQEQEAEAAGGATKEGAGATRDGAAAARDDDDVGGEDADAAGNDE